MMIKKSYAIIEQEPCDYKEYEKDLNKLKAQILEEGDTLVSKQDFLDRFVEVDREYKNSSWNLLQILTNIDILIGEEPCDDCISKQAVLSKIKEVCFSEEWLQFRVDKGSNGQRDFLINYIEQLSPATPQTRKGHWVNGEYCSECGCDVPTFIIDWRWQEEKDRDAKYCPNCGAKMKGKSEEEKNDR